MDADPQVYIPVGRRDTKEPSVTWRERLSRFVRGLGDAAYSTNDLVAQIRAHQEALQLPEGLRDSQLIRVLTGSDELREIEIHPKTRNKAGEAYKTIKRWTWGNPSAYRIALSLRGGSYLSHATALKIHGLIEDRLVPEIYVNKEQSVKPKSSGALSQVGIDRAFRSKVRSSNYIYTIEDCAAVLLNGKQTKKLGVENFGLNSNGTFPCTDIERTLIDIVVRPNYAGGVANVLNAFRAARGRVDLSRLTLMLQRLEYVYPYHQAIGFYADQAGFDDKSLRSLVQLGAKYDFYVDYALRRTEYDPRWRVHYPAKAVAP